MYLEVKGKLEEVESKRNVFVVTESVDRLRDFLQAEVQCVFPGNKQPFLFVSREVEPV
jgi:hypothetical protein